MICLSGLELYSRWVPLKNVVLSDRAQLKCSVTAAIESRQLRCKTAAESFNGCTSAFAARCNLN